MIIKGSLLLSAPIVKHFRPKKRPVLGQNLTALGDKQGFKIKCKFYNNNNKKICKARNVGSWETNLRRITSKRHILA